MGLHGNSSSEKSILRRKRIRESMSKKKKKAKLNKFTVGLSNA